MADFSKETIPSYMTPAQLSVLTQAVPDDLIETIEGHKFVNHTFVTSILNKCFGFCWNWTILDKGINEVMPFKSRYNNNSQNSAAETVKTYYAWVLGELSVPLVDPITGSTIWIKKQAFGGKQIVGNAKVQSNDWKGASSDALKKASSLLGIAPNIYQDTAVYNLTLQEEADPDSWSIQWKVDLYADEIQEMRKLKQQLGEEGFNKVVKQFCDTTSNYTKYGEITPSNICDFLGYLSQNNNSTATVAPAQPQAPSVRF